MIEILVNSYYSENWDTIAMQCGFKIIRECLCGAKGTMTSDLWTKISEGWFHDTYIMQLHFNDTNSFRICILKDNEKKEIVELTFSSVKLFECVGPLLEQNTLFPPASFGKPIAQILDIWIELTAKNTATIFILLDYDRYFHIEYHTDTLLSLSYSK